MVHMKRKNILHFLLRKYGKIFIINRLLIRLIIQMAPMQLLLTIR